MVEINLVFVILTTGLSVLLAIAILLLAKFILTFEKGRNFVKWWMSKS